MNIVQVKITGTETLLMHSGLLADPLNEYARKMKSITSKRIKTDEDYEALSKYEFLGGLYYDKTIGVYVPSENIEACIRDAAKLKRGGKTIDQALRCATDRAPLIYDGPKNPSDMFPDARFRDVRGVKIGKNRVIRTRPKFPIGWEVAFELQFDPSVLSPTNLREYVEQAGEMIGLGDWRPRFGRFEVTSWRTA